MQLRRIGDALLCSPAVRALAAYFPDADVDFLAEPSAAEVFQGNPRLRDVLVAPTDTSLSSFFRFGRELRRRRYDWVVDFFSNPRSAQFVFFTGARVRVGLDRFGRRWSYTHRVIEEADDRDLYAVDLRLRILERLNVPAAGRALEIFSDHRDAAEAARGHDMLARAPSGTPIVALAVGSPNPAKFYPPELTARLIQGLRANGFFVIVTSGPGETALAEETLALLADSPPHLTGARAASLAALYRRASVYVGPDSAPKHIAAACGIPTVAFFGAGRPVNWQDTQNPQDTLLIAPCELRPHCTGADCARRHCLRRISPEEICASAARFRTPRREELGK
ncbi:MAG: glycosyltransferase family 9 protein [bacterium]|nr:glycosyltransferase family 9 protein [bacterium]